MFPLSIFPLPGELVPLHIFEPRYRQLLEEAETKDMAFGIYFNHTSNTEKLGSLVKLESVIKRYPGGESDIIVRCLDLFRMDTLYRTYKDRLYPGGEVFFWEVDTNQTVSKKLVHTYIEYLGLLKITNPAKEYSAFQIANELSLDFEDRLKFVHLDEDKKEFFLLTRLKFQTHLLHEADKAKDVFHLN
jgi:uncharacterized protein